MRSVAGLKRQVDRLSRIAHTRPDQQQDPIIRCVWGDEHVDLESGEILIKTHWGRGTDPRIHHEDESMLDEEDGEVIQILDPRKGLPETASGATL